MPMDARVRYTKKVLRSALFECLKEKRLQSVTIKELCEKAELNRATFYKHYRDCYDMVDQLTGELEEDFRQILMSRDKFGTDFTEAILELLDRNRDISEAAVNGRISEHLRISMMEMAHEYCIQDWRHMMNNLTVAQVDMVFSAVMAAVFQLAVMESGKYERRAIVDFTQRMINAVVKQYS